MPLCDASTLPGAASCFSCKVPKGFRATLNVAYLASFTGYTGTPQGLLDQSNSWQKVTGDLILAAKVWIAASHSGYSTDPNSLLALAACYLSCIDNGNFGDVESYLYAVNAGNSTDPAGEFAAAAPYQLLRGSEWRAELWLLDNLDGMNDPDAAIRGAVCLLNCLTPGMLKAIYAYILCQGLGANLIPTGSTYTGSTPEFDIAITANTYYRITWGANDVSATVCGTTYPSTGAKNETVFYSGSCTLLQLFGNAAGTGVTAILVAVHNVKTAPSKFTFTPTSAALVTATWDTPPAPPTNNPYVVSTQLWTSTDGVTYTLASTVAAPATSTTVAAPTLGNVLYGKAKWIYSDGGDGGFSPAYEVFGAVTDWATRVVTNGGAAVSAATMQAMNTFYSTLNAAGTIIGKIKSVICITPGSFKEAVTPLIKAAGSDPWGGTSTNFELTVNGIRATSNNNVLNSGVLPSTAFGSTADGGLSCYVYTTTALDSSAVDMGSNNGSSSTCQLYTNFSGSAFSQIYNNTTGSCGGLGNGAGFYSGNVTGAAAQALYYYSSTLGFTTIATIATGGGTRPAYGIYGMGVNIAGVTGGTTTVRRYSHFCVHSGFTLNEAKTYAQAVQQLRQSLGGGFV